MSWANIINKVDREKRNWAKQATTHCIDFECPKNWDKALQDLEKK